MQPFDPLDMPLEGRRLVEAGAGTGKTWALTLLALRMVLEKGLGLEQILVLTYTRAATAELKTRIRDRLRLARLQLEGAVRPGDEGFDQALAAVLRGVPPETAAQRLRAALHRMDEAAITTIHGFCQKLIQDQALEAGLPLGLEVLPDETALREEAAADFWRSRFYPLGPEEARLAASRWPGPRALLAAAAPALGVDDDCVLPRSAGDALEAALVALGEALPELRRMWLDEREAILANVADAGCWKKGSPCHPDALPGTLAELAALLEGPEPRLPCLLPEALAGLAAEALADSRKKTPKNCRDWEPHPFFDAFGRFWRTYQQMLECWQIAVLQEARAFLQAELPRRKLEQGLFGYDDMLVLVASALADPERGPRLASAVRRRYRAVFVDEFQDSDPVQYRIFDAIAREPGYLLVMIGDPKQAIYAFRGGDIFTYMRARRECPETGRYTMAANYRSAPAMVTAVNALFGRKAGVFVFADIPFHPAAAAGKTRDEDCLVDGAPLGPLNVFLLTDAEEKALSRGQADARAAGGCARAIRRLLDLAEGGRAEIGGRPISGGDIAVLVADHRQAELMRQALGVCGLASVYAGKLSVFSSREAAELESLFRALLNPHDQGLRAEALNTGLFGLGVAELAQLAAGGEENILRLVRELEVHWRREGVGPMLYRLFRERRLAARLGALPDGERRLTNFLHLAELLDAEEALCPGRERLLRLLERRRREAKEGNDTAEERLLRLESDRSLVGIHTLHGAKGLEYPLVFLPFLWRSREEGEHGAGRCIRFHDRDSLRAQADFAAAKGHAELAAEEERAEAMRLLYVGLTRAKYGSFFCWGRVNGLAATPLAFLLHGGEPGDEAALRADLAALNETGAGRLVLCLPPGTLPWEEEGAAAREKPVPALAARPFDGVVPPGLGSCSFTGIVSGREPASDMEEKGGDGLERPLPAPLHREEKFTDIADFPRGMNAGSCLHRMLELLDFTRPVAGQLGLVAAQLERHGLDQDWTGTLAPWLEGVLATELPGSRPLGGLPACDRLNELRFHFPLRGPDFRRLDRLLEDFGLPPLGGTGSGEVWPGPMEQLMTGSIDLVFRHEGRFFVVDYKSNHLGRDAADYGEAALAEVMARHHYHLQYLIYSLALRRHLRARGCPADRVFGGVYYLFARGMRPGKPYGIFRADPAPALLRGLEEVFGCAEVGHAG